MFHRRPAPVPAQGLGRRQGVVQGPADQHTAVAVGAVSDPFADCRLPRPLVDLDPGGLGVRCSASCSSAPAVASTSMANPTAGEERP